MPLPPHLSARDWLDQMFTSATARKGGIVKRQVRDVERLVGREAFAAEVRRRGFQALRNGGHFIVICNDQPIYRLK
ncbi:hypothetical protein [Pseudaestuariivita atlantica]|uniref:N-(5'-phosphoribosyl)anthranilate isomerase n=1 Tax=Pseudaestuariivita atlantica TaxID=1317121 RepID=A0A0L1JUX4_9RHOB|nr:hypothetical protein [Pseudaestuariivita atlantica]KNG95208.1 N-(5'-phosphoribosyl)anthranilate isomerase [Pseudaestuariivita atlantica]